MPIQFACQCGKRLEAPERRRGTRSRCPACGVALTVPHDGASSPSDGPPASADPQPQEAEPAPPDSDLPIPLLDEESLPTRKTAPAPAVGESTFRKARGRRRPPSPRPKRRPEAAAPSYSSDLRATLLFPGNVNSLIIYLIVCLILCLKDLILPYGLVFGWIGAWIIYAWYCAFRFDVILSAASGDDELPRFSVEDILPGIARWWGTWIVVLLPALAYVILWQGVRAPQWLYENLGDEAEFAVESAQALLFFGLFLGGLFLWPITALCVAMGGFSTLSRVDLIVLTVLKSLPVYVPTVIVVFLALSRDYVLMPAQGIIGMFGGALLIAVGLYLELVAMRMIGLYYHHFKHRFAWSWG